MADKTKRLTQATSTTSAAPDGADAELKALAAHIRDWAAELGFDQLGITAPTPGSAERRFNEWLNRGYAGEMDYMARHGARRSRPALLEPGTLRVISVRLDYWPGAAADADVELAAPARGYISRYALGRDYHKVLRGRLARLARRIADARPGAACRAFTDSAPVLEKPLAEAARLGWTGKHTNLINEAAGSWFFLGELYTNLALPIESQPPTADRCGRCRRCIDACPTGAIRRPYELDARLCISYLTIELHGPIPTHLRPMIGNRVYGCDDCQLVCPWNRFAQPTRVGDFEPRHGLDAVTLVELFAWSEAEFLEHTAGSAIRRIGYERWLRNVAVALGNGPASDAAVAALRARADHPSALVREHVAWALGRLHVRADPDSADNSADHPARPSRSPTESR